MKRAWEKKKLWKKISAALIATLLWGGAPLALPVEAADPPSRAEVDGAVNEHGIQISGHVLILSPVEWTKRTLYVNGSGRNSMTLYSGEKTLTPTSQDMYIGDSNDTYVSLYGGYYDGITEPNPEDVKGNTINILDTMNIVDGWVVYEKTEQVGSQTGYSQLNIHDNNDTHNLHVNVIAGHAGKGEASDNTINVYGGSVSGYLIAAESKNTAGTAKERLHDNTINLYGKADLEFASIFGAALFDDTTRSRSVFMGTNNTLNTYVQDVTVMELGGFNNYNFHLPETVKNQDVMINVRGNSLTDISGSTVKAYVPNSPYLKTGDRVNLIINPNGITDSAATKYIGVNSETGLPRGETALSYYDIITEKQDESHVIVRLAGENSLKPQTKQIPQVRIPTLLNRGGDFMAGGGAASAEASGAQVYTPFFAASGASMRHTTGSHVDMRGYSMVMGMSKRIENEKHRMLIAPMVEYGRGNYDAYLDGGTHGKGTNQYIGGGIVFRNTMSDGKFYEGSFRAGRVKSDYTSNDFSIGRRPVSESFRTSSAYFGGHLGVGRDLKLSRNDPYPDRFVYYSKLFYTRTAADDVTLATGELYHLDAVDSLRLRLGAKYIYNVNEIHKFYLGMAWEHEFDGSSHAEYKGLRTDTPSIRGDSGMVEIGWNYEPKGDNRFSVDLSAIGWFGRQRGISGRLGINWLF